jgi:hypothetical protein
VTAWQLGLLFVLAVFCIAQGLCLLALARTIGILQLRLGRDPGALDTGEGLALHEKAPVVTAFDLVIQQPRVLAFDTFRFALIFVDAVCGTCRDLIKDAARLDKSNGRGARMVIISKGSHRQNDLLRLTVPRLMFLSDPAGDMQRLYEVHSTPFAFVIKDGQIQAKGIVNHRDHLESLLDSTMTHRSSVAWVPTDPLEDSPVNDTTEGAIAEVK